jgi:hypothetical protein
MWARPFTSAEKTFIRAVLDLLHQLTGLHAAMPFTCEIALTGISGEQGLEIAIKG